MTLTPEHQATIKAMAGRLHDLAGIGYATIYGDLTQSFRVARHADIEDANWPDVASWFQQRIAAAEKRRARCATAPRIAAIPQAEPMNQVGARHASPGLV